MRIHVFQHVSFEDIGVISDWVMKVGGQLSYTKFYENASLPKLEEIDLLIILGGPMSVNEMDKFAYLKDEIRFIGEAIKQEKPVLGICLGAQLIAKSQGAEVLQNEFKEIGWFPITWKSSFFEQIRSSFPAEQTVFHWHGEMFRIPEKAFHIASSEACQNQGFVMGEYCIGLQFHLEMDKSEITRLLPILRKELVESPHIQSEENLAKVTSEVERQNKMVLENILNWLIRDVN